MRALAALALSAAVSCAANNTAHDGYTGSVHQSICAPEFEASDLELTERIWGIRTECPGFKVVVVDIPDPNVGGRLTTTAIWVDIGSVDLGLSDIVIAHEVGHYLGYTHCLSDACDECDVMLPSVSMMDLECVRNIGREKPLRAAEMELR
jgi:hypothetical protein